MFLYELAVELGEHSNDLVEVATMLGVADAGPASQLNASQVAQLRAHFGGVATGPPPPPLGAPGRPAGTGPVAPASWGPPGTPSFEAVPGPPMGAPPPGTPGPVSGPGGPGERDGRLSKGQLLAIVGVVVVVAGLFAFMVVNTGPDRERQDALEAREQELAAATTEWVPPSEVPTTTAAPVVTAAPMPRAAPGGITGGSPTEIAPQDRPPAPTDQTRFCSGARSIVKIEVALGQGFLDGDLAAVKDALAQFRGDWDTGVDHLLAGASARDRPLIEAYYDLYLAMYASIERSSSIEEVSEFLHANYTQAEIDVADPVNETAVAYCS